MKNSKITKPTIIKTKKYADVNGTLIPFYLNKIKFFKTKRIFIVKGNKNYTRGDHAHKKCTQIFIQLSGQTELLVFKNKKYRFTLDDKRNKLLIIPPLHWCNLKFKKNNSSFLVLCDYNYTPREYIRNFEKFKKIVNKN